MSKFAAKSCSSGLPPVLLSHRRRYLSPCLYMTAAATKTDNSAFRSGHKEEGIAFVGRRARKGRNVEDLECFKRIPRKEIVHAL